MGAEMLEIVHRVGVEGATPKEVHAALTTVDGLAGWWTAETAARGDADEVGGVVEFRFPPIGGFDLEVVDLVPEERVGRRVVDGPRGVVGHDGRVGPATVR